MSSVEPGSGAPQHLTLWDCISSGSSSEEEKREKKKDKKKRKKAKKEKKKAKKQKQKKKKKERQGEGPTLPDAEPAPSLFQVVDTNQVHANYKEKRGSSQKGGKDRDGDFWGSGSSRSLGRDEPKRQTGMMPFPPTSRSRTQGNAPRAPPAPSLTPEQKGARSSSLGPLVKDYFEKIRVAGLWELVVDGAKQVAGGSTEGGESTERNAAMKAILENCSTIFGHHVFPDSIEDGRSDPFVSACGLLRKILRVSAIATKEGFKAPSYTEWASPWMYPSSSGTIQIYLEFPKSEDGGGRSPVSAEQVRGAVWREFAQALRFAAKQHLVNQDRGGWFTKFAKQTKSQIEANPDWNANCKAHCERVDGDFMSAFAAETGISQLSPAPVGKFWERTTTNSSGPEEWVRFGCLEPVGPGKWAHPGIMLQHLAWGGVRSRIRLEQGVSANLFETITPSGSTASQELQPQTIDKLRTTSGMEVNLQFEHPSKPDFLFKFIDSQCTHTTFRSKSQDGAGVVVSSRGSTSGVEISQS